MSDERMGHDNDLEQIAKLGGRTPLDLDADLRTVVPTVKTGADTWTTLPAHYALTPEPIDVIRQWGLNYNLGAVVKYIARHGRKPGESALSDLRKARDYIDHEIAHLRAQEQR